METAEGAAAEFDHAEEDIIKGSGQGHRRMRKKPVETPLPALKISLRTNGTLLGHHLLLRVKIEGGRSLTRINSRL